MKKIIGLILLCSSVCSSLHAESWTYTKSIINGNTHHKASTKNDFGETFGITCISNPDSINLILVLAQNRFLFVKNNEDIKISIGDYNKTYSFLNYNINTRVLMLDAAKENKNEIKDLLWKAYFNEKITLSYLDKIYYEFPIDKASSSISKMYTECLS